MNFEEIDSGSDVTKILSIFILSGIIVDLLHF